MPFTDQLGQAATGRAATLANIELGIGAVANPSSNAPLFIGVVQGRFAPVPKVVQRSTTQLDVVPNNFDIAATETYPYIVDVTNYLGTGDTISSVVATLQVLRSGVNILNSGSSIWHGTITIAGNQITIPINCNVLRYGQTYKILVTFQASSSKIATYTGLLRMIAGGGGVTTPSQLDTYPATFVVSINETAWPYTIDASNFLVGNDVINTATITSSLYFTTGITVSTAWQTSITTSGNFITVLTNLSVLALGQTYYILTTFTANTNKIVSYLSTVKVVA